MMVCIIIRLMEYLTKIMIRYCYLFDIYLTEYAIAYNFGKLIEAKTF